MMFVYPTPMRHTQLFTYLLLPAKREWPHSESKLTLGKAEMFYHCFSSDTSIPITLTKTGHQTGLNASNTRLAAYNGTQIPLFGSLHGCITWQPGSPSAQSPPDELLLVCGRHPWSCHPRGSHHVRDLKLSK